MIDKHDLQDGNIIYEFIQKKYLYWLEPLSLLNSISHAIALMLRLEYLLQVSFY